MTKLWTPIKVGTMQLRHRLALAPMTRSRALPDGTPGPLAAEYYAQRASLGLLITEGTQPSDDGQGYIFTPGIYTDAHVAGWREVTSAAHAAGATMFIQLMHVGRMSHPDNTPHHRQAVAPSALAATGKMFTLKGMLDMPAPRALELAEVPKVVEQFRVAAARAVEAGADGVEIHGANGYLVQQFLAASSNQRSDAYGGSIEKRARFAIEVARAIADEIGSERTAIRLSPGSHAGGIDEGTACDATYRYLVEQLAPLGLAYLHLMVIGKDALVRDVRSRWSGPLLLVRLDRTRETLTSDLESGLADVLPLGRWALANPDVVARLKTNAPFNDADPSTFYGGDAHGYTDYPALETSR